MALYRRVQQNLTICLNCKYMEWSSSHLSHTYTVCTRSVQCTVLCKYIHNNIIIFVHYKKCIFLTFLILNNYSFVVVVSLLRYMASWLLIVFIYSISAFSRTCIFSLYTMYLNRKVVKYIIIHTIIFLIKGTVQRDFRPPVFFPHSNQSGPLINGLKYFRF